MPKTTPFGMTFSRAVPVAVLVAACLLGDARLAEACFCTDAVLALNAARTHYALTSSKFQGHQTKGTTI